MTHHLPAAPAAAGGLRLAKRVGTALAAASVLGAGSLLLNGAAGAAAGADHLSPSELLGPGERLVSSDGRYVLAMQGDGNLVEYAPGNRAVWASGTGRVNSIARMQADGNLVVIAPGNVAVWSTGTNGNPDADLELQSDGNLVVYGQGHVARWASASAPSSSALGDRIAAIARDEAMNPARNHEAGGSNCNVYSTGLRSGRLYSATHKPLCTNGRYTEEWCADFARWVWGQAGAATSGLTAGAISFRDYGNGHATWHPGAALTGARPGDAIGYHFGANTGDDHVGLVVAVGTNSITTVEGNYSNAVTTRTIARNAAGISGYTRPFS